MELDKPGINWQESLVLFVGLTGLVALLLLYNKPPIYDEDDYLLNVALIQQYGLSKTYLLKHIGSAGPLYPVLHFILKPITHLETPYIRLVNVFLLMGSIWITGLTLNKIRFPKSYAWLALAVPMTYVISGLALTEMPAIFFLSAATFFVVKVYCSNLSFITSALHLIVAGLFFSLAILGRQPYILVLGALPILFFQHGNFSKYGSLMLVTIFFSLALPSYVFSVWNGLVAPGDAALYNTIAEEGVRFRPLFFFNCIAYYAMVFFIVTPAFYIVPSKKETISLGIVAVLLVLLNFHYNFLMYIPMEQLLAKLVSPSIIVWGKIIFGVGLTLGSLFFLVTLFRQLARYKYPPTLLFFAAALLLVAVACIKITWGFSSRYPAQALPFLVPMFAYFYRENKFNIYRLGVGVLLGLVSFVSYIAIMH